MTSDAPAPAPPASAAFADAPLHAAEQLARFEERLDPARPETSGAQVIGYGEISTVLALPGFPDSVCKRMAGFADATSVTDYLAVVGGYLECLRASRVPVVATAAVAVHTAASGFVVYLLQPRLDPARIGSDLLRTGSDAAVRSCVEHVLVLARVLVCANHARTDGREIAFDGQLSNFHFPTVGAPRLLDVGTPFMRRHGTYEIDVDLLLAPVPLPLRALYRRARAVERYFDDYFDVRRLTLDLLGNFHKEGRPDRIDLALAHANAWLAGAGADLGVVPLTRVEVDAYYRKDARLLELYLKVRRLDRFVRTRLFGQRYNFVLPGPVRR